MIKLLRIRLHFVIKWCLLLLLLLLRHEKLILIVIPIFIPFHLDFISSDHGSSLFLCCKVTICYVCGWILLWLWIWAIKRVPLAPILSDAVCIILIRRLTFTPSIPMNQFSFSSRAFFIMKEIQKRQSENHCQSTHHCALICRVIPDREKKKSRKQRVTINEWCLN